MTEANVATLRAGYETLNRGDLSGRGRGSGVDIAVEIAHVWTVRAGRAVRLESYPNVEAAREAALTRGSARRA